MGLLPTEKSQPKASLSDYSMLIYGAPKMGKSTFASEADGVVMLATEPGLNALSCYQVSIPDYPTFSEVCLELAEMKHNFKVACVDTVDNLYTFVTQYVCKKHGIETAGDLEYGKGFSLINGEFQRVLTRLAHLPMGLILTSHEKSAKFKGKGGAEVNKIIPTIPGQGMDIVTKLCDLILYADQDVVTTEGEVTARRVIRTKPHPHYIAGDRTKRLPAVLPLSYAVLREEFEGPNGTERANAAKARELEIAQATAQKIADKVSKANGKQKAEPAPTV